jgi:putative ubiquitin-RnfH superfamily antitoxin RatB of RatAB toxin-antitoxin module
MNKRCVVAYATRDEQWLWTVEVPAAASVAEVIDAARLVANRDEVPWESVTLGIFGKPCNRTDIPAEGDRIEIYRPLASDPKARRRQQVQNQRRAARRAGSR